MCENDGMCDLCVTLGGYSHCIVCDCFYLYGQARRFIESVRMMACVICASRWEASHCIVCDCFYLYGQTGGHDSVGTTVFVYSPSTLLDFFFCVPS